MKKRLLAFGILMVCLMTLIPLSPALAQDNTIELTATYSKLEITSGASVAFNIDVNYTGDVAQVFDLSATGPANWNLSITPSYPQDKQILNIRMEPPTADESSSVQTIIVTATPATGYTPPVGEYPITVEASSGNLKSSIELTVVVTSVPPTYALYLTSPNGILSTTAQTGKDNYFTLAIANQGTGDIQNISISTSKPTGWTVELSLNNIPSLAAGNYQTVDMNIKPPADTIAGDYQVNVTASGTQSSDSLEVRVTVKTSSLWGWVGIGIIVLVIVGLAVIFLRFSRR
jgi:uncharacterized membrane protein